MDIERLVNLTSKAWSLKILALLHDGVPGRLAPLLARTAASRSAFSASLDHLVEIGLLERNPGHGHPLRPEFRLTRRGTEAAALASRIMGIIADEEAFTLIRRSWTVPVLAVTASPRRFSIIRSGLGRITDRALSKSLASLEERDWIKRDITLSERSPFPTYQAVNTGESINRAVGLRL